MSFQLLRAAAAGARSTCRISSSVPWTPRAMFKLAPTSPMALGIRANILRFNSTFASPNSPDTLLGHQTHQQTSSPSSSYAAESSTPPLSPPSVSNWLLASAALVFGIVVVGGVTRLTESGLSIVEWRPVTGTLPPLSEREWQEEFEKYKTSPEFKLMNHSISLSEFKRIFFWEYTHRLLGRLIGVSFVIPLAYFYTRRRLTAGLPPFLLTLGALIGAQGALGWYMVKSGLDEKLMTTPGAVPRVSQYRLAAHLSMALALFIGMLGAGLQVRRDWKWANGGTWSGLAGSEPWSVVQRVPDARRFKMAVVGMLGLVFLTAFSGAFVAGLDAGLVYNEFPTMGDGRIAPPLNELYSPFYAKRADGSDMWWRNLFENPSTVQFNHRVLATTTYLATTTLFLTTLLSPALKASLPPLTLHLTRTAFALVNLQVTLGITTLLYLVPVPLAAAHQAGSVLLLASFVGLIGSLRRPGASSIIRRAGMDAARASRGKV